MKKPKFYTGFLGLIAALALFIGGCGGGSSVETLGFSTYENEKFGVNILYSEDWEDFENSTAISFWAPDLASRTRIRTNFVVRVFEYSSEELQDYVDLGMKFLEGIAPGLNILESSRTTLDGNVAHKVVYTAESGHKVMEIWTLKDGIAYDLVYGSKEDEYDLFLDTAQRMIDSFEITSSRPPALFSSEPIKFFTYQNIEHRIMTLHPSNWRGLLNFGNTVITFLAPGGRTSFGIATSQTSYTVNEEYISMRLEDLEESIEDLSVINSEMVELDGDEAHKVVYTGADGLKGMQIWTIKDGMAYDLIYTSNEGEYDLFVDGAQGMIDSFEITSP